MTVPLSPGSPRRVHAHRFAAVLREAMTRAGIGAKTLAPQVPCAPSALGLWRAGENLPTMKSALRLSEALSEPRLLEIVREAREGVCQQCGRQYSNEGGAPKRYCSVRCRDDYNRAKSRAYQPEPDVAFAKTIERLVDEPGPVAKRDLRDAVATFRAERPKRTFARLERKLDLHAGSIERFCRSCEWDGICKTPECELRPVSPLPLAIGLEIPEPAEPAEGPWGEGNREHMLEAVREANGRRWSRPGEREKASDGMKRWWIGMTPSERVAHIRKLSESRKGQATYRACGCPNRAHRAECALARRRVA